MRRSIKSNQRHVLEYNVVANAAGTALTGLDSKQVTMADTGTGDKLITIPKALFNMVVQVSTATTGVVAEVGTVTSTTVQVLTFDTATGATATDGIVHITIKGTEVDEQY